MCPMSDSDDNSDLPPSVFSFENQSTTLYVKGPNVNSTTNMSFRNTLAPRTLPWNSQRPRYAESVYDQPSSYSRREVSPMSLHSASGLQSRNMYYSRMGSQRSIYERSGSSKSVRTMDSNTSVSAVDIAAAFRTMHFNKCELQMIKEAYNKYMKSRVRKRIEKRRNLRRFLKGSRHASGGESGEQGSDSSLSAEECRSVRSYRTTDYRENTRFGCNSTRTDFTGFRKTMQDSNIYRDCTDSFKQYTLRNMFPAGPRSVNEVSRYRPQNNALPVSSRSVYDESHYKPQTNAVLQKGRLRNEMPLPSLRFNHSSWSIPGKNDSVLTQKHQCSGFQIASHRFNKNESMASVQIPDKQLSSYENDRMLNVRKGNNFNQQQLAGIDSEQEDIFSEITVMEKSTYHDNRYQNKRSLGEDVSVPVIKKSKLSPPQKFNGKSKTLIQKKTVTGNNSNSNEFVFAKPQFPLRKSGNVKKQDIPHTKSANEESSQQPREKVNTNQSQMTATNNSSSKLQPEIPYSTNPPFSKAQKCTENLLPKPLHPEEQLISKSAQPLDTTEPLSVHQTKDQCNPSDITSMSTAVSMRPSFTKRKLFSQKAVMYDNRNYSSDNLEEVDTHDSIYSYIQREKNKARKLVTSQSCLSRDILGDESNLLDLIHKKVPPDRMNITTATNRSKLLPNKAKENDTKKWDISTVISTCNNTDDMSDTYTDEEIFKPDETVKSRKEVSSKSNKVVQNKEIESKSISDTKLMKETIKSRKDIPNIRNDVVVKAQAGSETKSDTKFKHNKMISDTKLKNDIATTDTKLKNDKAMSDSKLKNNKTISDTKFTNNNIVVQKDSLKCKVVVAKLKPQNYNKVNELKDPIKPDDTNDIKRTLEKRVKSFWDTDVESDFEYNKTPPGKKIPTNNSTKDTSNKQNRKVGIQQDIENIAPVPKIKTHETTVTAQNHNKKGRRIKDTQKPKDDPKVQPEIIQPKLNLTLQIKSNDVTLAQKPKKQVALNKNGTLKVDSIHKIHNSTLRIRAPRTPKIKLCCSDSPKVIQSLNDTSNINNSRSLRSRTIDLSTSPVVKDTPLKKTAPKSNKAAKNKNISIGNKNIDNSLSDLSFTLNTDKMKQTTAPNKRVGRTRRSDVSFSPTTDKNLDNMTNKRLDRSKNINTPSRETRALKRDLSKLAKKSPLRETVNKTNVIHSYKLIQRQRTKTIDKV